MTPPLIEDRLRAHFADEAARQPLGEPDPARIVAAAHARVVTPRRRRVRVLVAGAVAAACILAVVAVVITDDGNDKVDMSRPGPTTETTERRLPSTTAPSTPTPTSVPEGTTAAAPPTGATLVVSRDGVLGSWDGTGWVRSDPADRPAVQGGEQYQVARLGQPVTSATGSGPLPWNCGVEDSYRVDAGLGNHSGTDPAPVAVRGVADVQPRAVVVVDPSDPVTGTYRDDAVGVLAGLGIQDPDPPVVQVVRADLDGDGSDEVLVRVERLADPGMLRLEQGDYSVVFLRHRVAGQVRIQVVAAGVAQSEAGQLPFMLAHAVGAVADLNGDGRMEVVLASRFYEGRAIQAYEVQGDTLTEVLSLGCGG